MVIGVLVSMAPSQKDVLAPGERRPLMYVIVDKSKEFTL